MIVELNTDKGYCKVTKEKGDKSISKSGYNGTIESTFLYKVKIELIKQGYDIIKKRIASDPGNMVDEYQQWIRTRKWKGSAGEFAIYNSQWAIFDAGKIYNEDGEFVLAVLNDKFD
jgi:hypothetical protein